MKRILLVAGLALVAAAGAIFANVALLGYAEHRNDPVGRLSPRLVLHAPRPAPAPFRPAVVPREPERADD